MSKSQSKWTASLLYGLMVSVSWPVLAQQDIREGSEERVIEEVLVTSRKVEESLQTVPLAVTAIGGAELQRRYASDIKDLEGFAPNVTIGTDAAYGNVAHFSIRGLTQMDPERSFEPATGIAVDGVFIPSLNTSLIDMFDVERIEILRGPQGTIFGRNTIGGVVNVSRKRPDHEFGGEVEVTFGSFERLDLKAAVNFSVVEDVLAVRAAVLKFDSEGWADNQVTGSPTLGKHRMGNDSFYGRLAFLFTPTDNLEVYMNLLRYVDNGDAGAVANFTRPGFLQCTVFMAQACGVEDNEQVWDNTPNINKVDNNVISLEINWDNDWGTITSLFSYRDEDSLKLINYDASELLFFEGLRDEWQKTYSAEIRYTGTLIERVDLIAGGFYWNDESFIHQDNEFFFIPFPDPRETQIKTESFAFFGEINWEVIDNVRLIAGLRYTEDDKTLVRFFPNTFGGPVNVIGGIQENWSNVSPRFGIDWQVSDTVFLYGSFSEGYRAGGFNGRAGSPASGATPYNPETADSFEIGTKLDLFDRRVRLNIAGFHVKYEGLQIDNIKTVVFNGVTTQETVVDNAASAKVTGLEVEASVLLTDTTRFNGTLGYMDARYGEFLLTCGGGVCGNPGDIVDFSDKNLRRAPELQFAVGLEQTIPTAWGDVVALANYHWTDSFDFIIDNDPRHRRPSVGFLDASLTFYANDSGLRVSLFGKNLTDKQAKEFAFVVDALGWELGAYNKPREFGVQVGYSF